MKRTIIMLAALALSACTVATKQVHLPSGKLGYTLDCSGPGLSWADCQEKAGEICGDQGYTVVDRVGEKVSSSSSTVSGHQAGSFGNVFGSGFSSTKNIRTMLISCGAE